jgi:hypothetical protein
VDLAEGWASGVSQWSSVCGISWSSSISDWSGMVNLGDGWGSSISNWSSCNDWSCVNLGNSDSWSLTIDNSVESVDGVSGVSNGTDGTIGLNKRVLSLDNISVAALLVVLGISGQTVLDGISVVVLWVGIVWLWGNSDGSVDLGDGWSSSISYWSSVNLGKGGGSGVSQRSSAIGSDWTTGGGISDSQNGQEGHDLEHVDCCFC